MSAPYRPGLLWPSLPEQIPPVAGDVDEHGDASVRHLTNGGDELDARGLEIPGANRAVTLYRCAPHFAPCPPVP